MAPVGAVSVYWFPLHDAGTPPAGDDWLAELDVAGRPWLWDGIWFTFRVTSSTPPDSPIT
jgi:hypothetical protein